MRMSSNKPSCIKVTIHSGTFHDTGGLSCRITVGRSSHLTPTLPGRHPRWRSHFVLPYAKQEALRFEILSEQSDVTIGYVDIDLMVLKSLPDQHFRGKLELKPSGSLRASLQFYPKPTSEASVATDGVIVPGSHKGGAEEASPSKSRPACPKIEIRHATNPLPRRPPVPQSAPPYPADDGHGTGERLAERRENLLMFEPRPPDDATTASLWMDMASSKQSLPDPDPEFKRLLQKVPPSSKGLAPRLFPGYKDARRRHTATEIKCMANFGDVHRSPTKLPHFLTADQKGCTPHPSTRKDGSHRKTWNEQSGQTATAHYVSDGNDDCGGHAYRRQTVDTMSPTHNYPTLSPLAPFGTHNEAYPPELLARTKIANAGSNQRWHDHYQDCSTQQQQQHLAHGAPAVRADTHGYAPMPPLHQPPELDVVSPMPTEDARLLTKLLQKAKRRETRKREERERRRRFRRASSSSSSSSWSSST